MTTAAFAPRAAPRYERPRSRHVLITGSRYWDNEELLRTALLDAWQPGTLLISGNARGADRMAEELWEGWGGLVVRYPADWNRACDPDCQHGPRPMHANGTSYCPEAGLARNQTMVNLGADTGIACLKIGARNRGTLDCTARAEAAGIPIVRVKG
jgi:hypothetical protein